MVQAGNLPMRSLALALAWGGRRWQPARALPPGEPQRWGHGRSWLRRLGLVALARQWLRAVWRCGETGVWPDGAARTGAGRLSPSRR
jgi:hypothetical protein